MYVFTYLFLIKIRTILFVDNETVRERLIGGEAMISEVDVEDFNHFRRVWPRASMAAGKLWSFPEMNNTYGALIQFDIHSSRLSS